MHPDDDQRQPGLPAASFSTLVEVLAAAAAAAWDSLACPVEQLEKLQLLYGLPGIAADLVDQPEQLAVVLAPIAEQLAVEDLQEWWQQGPAGSGTELAEWQSEAAVMLARLAPLTLGD